MFLQADGRIFEIRDGKILFVAGIPELPIKVYAGGAHLGCVTFESSVYAWGTGTHGQLGTGSFLNSEDPRQVRPPPERRSLTQPPERSTHCSQLSTTQRSHSSS
jgi:alpha-tubulin suppressor-like RCC1 family protein